MLKEKNKEPTGFYKGYDIKWLKNELQHPDYYLVEEYKKKNRKVKDET